MATVNPDNVTLLSKEAQNRLLKYGRLVLEKKNDLIDIHGKMDAIDVAYARYKEIARTGDSSGVDNSRVADTSCNVFAQDDVTPPIVVSQVDSYVAYLAEVFLSGVPLFPVVSNPVNRQWAEQLESILDDHAQVGGYARQLLMFLRDGVKYNFSALEVEWTSIDQFSVNDDITSQSGQKIDRTSKKYNKLKRLNPRNVVWDWACHPGDVAEHGDFAGYVEKVSRTKLKRILNKWSKERKAYNVEQAMMSSTSNVTLASPHFTEDPQISDYVNTARSKNASPDWNFFFEGKQSSKRGPQSMEAMYEIFYLYVRIMPADFGIKAPQPNTPQIWKLAFVNDQVLVYADRIVSAYDYLPILFGQPLEDGMGYQTQSIAEGEIPFQDAARTLFNIRFAAARRAVSDRALYIPDMIKPSDINSPVPAPKIPVALTALSNKGIEDAYKQIPFDMRGTETAIQDASTIVAFSKELHGLNGPRQGQFQKGNKSVQEWSDTMSGSEGRMRLPAMTLEHQVFSPLKSIMVLNLFQYGEDGSVVSQITGDSLTYKMSELRRANLAFRIADGYTPKAKLGSPDIIMAGMQMIGNSPMLQQAFGNRVAGMFVHFMSLSGLKGFEQYDPMYKAPVGPIEAGNLAVNDPAAPGTQTQLPSGGLPAQSSQPPV